MKTQYLTLLAAAFVLLIWRFSEFQRVSPLLSSLLNYENDHLKYENDQFGHGKFFGSPETSLSARESPEHVPFFGSLWKTLVQVLAPGVRQIPSHFHQSNNFSSERADVEQSNSYYKERSGHQETVTWSQLSAKAQFLRSSFKAQVGQDWFVYQTFFRPISLWMQRGVFVEFGGRNGLVHSNTHFFEKELGWRGVLVEADPCEYPGIPRNRASTTIPVFGALGNEDNSSVTFLLSRFGGWSGFPGEYNQHRKTNTACPCVNISVPAYRLNTILNRAGLNRIEYMSVDTEGSELRILWTIDFRQTYFKVVQVEVLLLPETMESDLRNKEAIERLMGARGFQKVEELFVAHDTADLVFHNMDAACLKGQRVQASRRGVMGAASRPGFSWALTLGERSSPMTLTSLRKQGSTT